MSNVLNSCFFFNLYRTVVIIQKNLLRKKSELNILGKNSEIWEFMLGFLSACLSRVNNIGRLLVLVNTAVLVKTWWVVMLIYRQILNCGTSFYFSDFTRLFPTWLISFLLLKILYLKVNLKAKFCKPIYLFNFHWLLDSP